MSAGCALSFNEIDGMLARLLHAYSPIGKELDSLADDVSFGVAPSLLVFSFLKESGLIYPDFLAGLRDYIPYLAFLISIFSALRLANFNVDERQTSSFIGLPVPANALYWGALIVGGKDFLRLAHRLHLRFQRFHIVNKYRYNIFLLSHLDSLL